MKNGLSLFFDNLENDMFNDNFFNFFNGKNVTKALFNYVSSNETDNEYKYVLPVPGLNKNDIKIQLFKNNRYLGISYNENDKKAYYMKSFDEKISLSDNADIDNIKAEVKDGVLTITIPKLNVITDSNPVTINID